MPEEDHKDLKKIQCWIPLSTWDKLKERGYPTISKAVNEALDMLLEVPPKVPLEIPRVDIGGKSEFPEFPEMRARLEEKDKQIEEKDRHIETLKTELEKAGQDKEAIQNLYNNYMLQMQTLINQKALEAPGAKKPWWRFW